MGGTVGCIDTPTRWFKRQREFAERVRGSRRTQRWWTNRKVFQRFSDNFVASVSFSGKTGDLGKTGSSINGAWVKTGELTFNIHFLPERAPVPVLHNQPMHARGTMPLIKCFHAMEKKVITRLNLGCLRETYSKLEYHDLLILYYSL